MPNTLTVTQLQDAKTMVANGNLNGFYDYMSSQGYGYANLGNQLVNCSFPVGSTAQNFMVQSAKEQGVNLTRAGLIKLGGMMLEGWSRNLRSIYGTMNSSNAFRSALGYLVLFYALVLCACSWPWPHMTEYTQGLGQGQIANYLPNECCIFEEDRIAQKVKQMLVNARKTLPPRESAESIGMKCMAPPNTTCGYTGEMKWRLDRPSPPSNNPDAGKMHIVDIFILLPNNEELTSLTVHTSVRVAQ